MSAVTTCLSLSLHLSRSTSGDAGAFAVAETISECLGVAPHPSGPPRTPAERAAETTSDIRALDMSMAATVGRNDRFIKSRHRLSCMTAPPFLTVDLWSCMVMAMARKKISTTIYITPEQNEQLKLLNSKTRVPVAEYIRQGIDLVLDKERHNLPGQLPLAVTTRR